MRHQSNGKSERRTGAAACFAHHHMTFEEYGFWTYAREVSHESEVFYSGGSAVAGRFSGQGKDSAYRIAASLAAKGWLAVLKKGQRQGRHGVWQPAEYRVLSFVEWAAGHPDAMAECPICLKNKTADLSRNHDRHLSRNHDRHLSRNQESPFEKSRITFREISNKSEGVNLKKREREGAPPPKDGGLPGRAPLSPSAGSETPGQGHPREAGGRSDLAAKYFEWVLGDYSELALASKQKETIGAFILSSAYDSTVLRRATDDILGGLDLADSYSHAESKLAASLPEKCAAVAKRDARAKAEKELMDGLAAKARAEAEERLRNLPKVERLEDM